MAKIYTVVATLLEVCTSPLNKLVAELRDTILGIQADNLTLNTLNYRLLAKWLVWKKKATRITLVRPEY